MWSLPAEKVGAFVAKIPAPLGLGTVTLADGSAVLGFLCESYAIAARATSPRSAAGGPM